MLLWLSARREGSWAVFRSGVEQFRVSKDASEDIEDDNEDFPIHQRLRLNLNALGHVEFFANECENGWRVAPPTLATTDGPTGRIGILCGARTDELIERFSNNAETMQMEKIPLVDAPDAYRVHAKSDDELLRLANEVGISFQRNAALAILSQVQSITIPGKNGASAEYPVGQWAIHQFSLCTLNWVEVDRASAERASTGVFRFTIRFQRPRYFLRWSGNTHKTTRALAIYALLRRHRQRVLKYDPSTSTLALPGSCRPPQLTERALVLCSGMPSSFDVRTTRVQYRCVPPRIAQIAAQLLRQRLP